MIFLHTEKEAVTLSLLGGWIQKRLATEIIGQSPDIRTVYQFLVNWLTGSAPCLGITILTKQYRSN
jgi:hypothetical protein